MTRMSPTRNILAALIGASLLPATAWSFEQAPMLQAQVEAGVLPPVDERLPAEPRVIEPYHEIGTYGGTWRRGYSGIKDFRGPQKLLEPRIVKYYQSEGGPIELVPNWITHHEVSEDGSDYTFYIRDGVRWSDGVLLTTEDVRFYFENVIGEGNPRSIRPLLKFDGIAAELKIIDDLTFTVDFPGPAPLFIPGLGRQYVDMAMPSHYLKNYHPAFVSESDLAAAVQEFGVETWEDLWGERNGKAESIWINPDRPVLGPWVIATPPPAETMVFERNPYYFAVDTAGNQLPYIDRIEHRLFQDKETMKLWAAQGQIDLQWRHLSISDFPFFKENEANGGFEVVLWKGASTEALFPNQANPDAELSKLFQDSAFREALNISIDRDRINELVYLGLGESRQASPPEGSVGYSPELEAKWSEFDPSRAEEILNALGLEKGADGIRVKADGQPLKIVIDSSAFSGNVQSLELVEENWENVGIDVVLNVVDRTLYEERGISNTYQMGHWKFDRAANLLVAPGRLTGGFSDSNWAGAFRTYIESGGSEGVAPPDGHIVIEIVKLVNAAYSAPTTEDAYRIFDEILARHAEAPHWIGLVGKQPELYIRSNRMGNFPAGITHDDLLRDIGVIPTEQLFIRDQ